MNERMFRIKDAEGIISSGMSAVDMHFHSDFSVDCNTGVREIVLRARKLKIGVSITDHNAIDGSVKAQGYAKKKLIVVPGIEVTTSDYLHMLFYFYRLNDLKAFYRKAVKPNLLDDPYRRVKLDVEEAVRISKKFNAVVCVPHPYTPMWCALFYRNPKERLLKNVRLFEAFNSSAPLRSNLRAYEEAKKLGKGIVGGSDGHSLSSLGKALTWAEGSNAKEFLDSVIDNKSIITYDLVPFYSKLWKVLKGECIHMKKSHKEKLAFARLRVLVSKSLKERAGLVRFWKKEI